MFLRFLIISVLRFITNILVIYVLYSFLLPSQMGETARLILTWLVLFITAFVFATWALAKKIPTRQQVLMLIAIWLAVSVSIFLIYGIFRSPRGAKVLIAPEILFQFVLEIGAILLAAFILKRRALKSELGE